MPLITLRDVTFGFGGPPLLDRVSVAIEADERAALVGRNGVGKSTFLQVLAGEHTPDSGEIQRSPDLTVACLGQTVPAVMQGSVFGVIAAGLGRVGDAVTTHHRYARRRPQDEFEEHELARADEILRERDGWELSRRVETVISRLDLDADVDVAPLSAGVRRRVLLGRALVADPELLLLDEPTNHLDISSIEWLEGFLRAFRGAVLFITHDRVFVETVARRILDLDRGRLTSYACGWEKYLERKQEALDVEANTSREFDRKLAEEEVWIRKGVKERRKRNMGRVRELEKMRTERRDRRELLGPVRMLAQEAERTGRLVISAESISFAYGDRPVITDCSTTVQRGDRIGLIGPNGAGKTTLLRLLLKELEPNAGTLRHGTNLEIAYFDQLHSALDDEKSVRDNLSDGTDTLEIGGRRQHVVGYLQDFLFTPLGARSLVKTLSGGERNRLFLARLFSRPSNVLVLDEPTNDLDVETLDLLEELLLGYSGTVLVVSHDRAFLDHVVTSTFVFEGDGVVKEYVGGYSDWVRQRAVAATEPSWKENAKNERKTGRRDRADRDDRPRRLTYREREELAALPDRLETLEAEKEEILGSMARPEFYAQDRGAVDEATRRLESLEEELGAAYARWEELEDRSAG